MIRDILWSADIPFINPRKTSSTGSFPEFRVAGRTQRKIWPSDHVGMLIYSSSHKSLVFFFPQPIWKKWKWKMGYFERSFLYKQKTSSLSTSMIVGWSVDNFQVNEHNCLEISEHFWVIASSKRWNMLNMSHQSKKRVVNSWRCGYNKSQLNMLKNTYIACTSFGS